MGSEIAASDDMPVMKRSLHQLLSLHEDVQTVLGRRIPELEGHGLSPHHVEMAGPDFFGSFLTSVKELLKRNNVSVHDLQPPDASSPLSAVLSAALCLVGETVNAELFDLAVAYVIREVGWDVAEKTRIMPYPSFEQFVIKSKVARLKAQMRATSEADSAVFRTWNEQAVELIRAAREAGIEGRQFSIVPQDANQLVIYKMKSELTRRTMDAIRAQVEHGPIWTWAEITEMSERIEKEIAARDERRKAMEPVIRSLLGVCGASVDSYVTFEHHGDDSRFSAEGERLEVGVVLMAGPGDDLLAINVRRNRS